MKKSVHIIMSIAIVLILSFSPQAKADDSMPVSGETPGESVSQQTYDSISSSTTQIATYIDSNYVLVNNHTFVLDTPAILVQEMVFVPARNMANYLGVNLAWNPKLQVVEMKTAKALIKFDMINKLVWVNDVSGPLEHAAMMSKGRLMVRLGWFTAYAGAVQNYNTETKRIEISYVQQPESASDSAESSAPVAKFTFTQPSYRIGETIHYVDLSYDPDAEGIARYEWTGKQEVYFIAGSYPITLRVYDNAGHVSGVYSRNLIIENSTYMTLVQYRIHNQPVGTSFDTDWSMLYAYFLDLPLLQKQIVEDNSRQLLVSDSPETIKDKGILYQDTVNGKARLYADHVNGMTDKIQFSILAKNLTDQPVTLKTTNKGEVYPSIYANLIGHEASVDFMLHDPANVAPLVVQPGQTVVYVQMPNFYPGQGVNVFYDIETDGALQISFLSSDPEMPSTSFLDFTKHLPFDGHVRGTFPMADKTWNVDLTNFTKPTRLTIGDGVDDPFVKGYDTNRQMDVLNEGNYGMIYHIHADKPRKMALMLLAKGGPFKGPFKINGQFMMAPASGVINAFNSMQVLARTTGTEDSFDIEFTPPAGSAFPIDLIFYPLD